MNLERIFHRLVNTWSFKRNIDSKNKHLPSGVAIGHADFILVNPTLIHYFEKGIFTTNNHQTFNIEKRYAYTLKNHQSICKHFLEANNSMTPFYCLSFTKNKASSVATGTHLCKLDKYQAHYEFYPNEQFDAFNLTYEVKGPNKDYSASTRYELL